MDEPCKNFRELSVYPTLNDLEIEEPYLHPNIIKGPCRNVEHYLDVRFKLLREDFIVPLRNGIQSYKDPIHYKHRDTMNNIHNNNIHVYNDKYLKKFQETKSTKNQLGNVKEIYEWFFSVIF